MLPYLLEDTPFPPVCKALDDPNGLLAVGGDLSPNRLISAYSQGIFPWYSDGEPLLWWSPDPRAVFLLKNFKVKKSVKQVVRRKNLTITLNHAFEEVIVRCAEPRSEVNGVWITEEMIEAYCELHKYGDAHSVEVWDDDKLVGGIYGVCVGKVFCGESMFSEISNGSKVALTTLILYLKKNEFNLLDCQIENPHLTSLGAINLARELYIEMLNSNKQASSEENIWLPKELKFDKLLELSKQPKT